MAYGYEKLNMTKTCSIVILNSNGEQFLGELLSSIKEHTETPDYEIIAVDNGSTDRSKDIIKEFKDVILIDNKENLGIPKGYNAGIRKAITSGSDYIVLLQNDTKIITHNWLKNLVELAESDEKIGIIGPNMITPEGIDGPGFYMKLFRVNVNIPKPVQAKYPLEVDYTAPGAYFMTKKAINTIGLMDEGFSPIIFDDSDYYVRVKKAGFKIMYHNGVKIMHYGGSTIGKQRKRDEAKVMFYFIRHYVRFELLNCPIYLLMPKLLWILFISMAGVFFKRDGISIKFREKTKPHLFMVILKAYNENIKNLDEILSKRNQRDKFRIFRLGYF